MISLANCFIKPRIKVSVQRVSFKDARWARGWDVDARSRLCVSCANTANVQFKGTGSFGVVRGRKR